MDECAACEYLFESFRLTVAGKFVKLVRDGHEVNLEPDQAKVLQLLVENYGNSVKKRVLLTYIRREEDANFGPVYTAISDLRRILADPKEESRLIQTVPDGYQFSASVKKSPVRNQNDAGIDQPQRRSDTNQQVPAIRAGEKRQRENFFEEWIRGSGEVISRLLFICVIATVAISIGLAFGLDPNTAKVAASGAQCAVILIALLHSVRWKGAKEIALQDISAEPLIKQAGFENFADFESDRENLESALRQYTKYWRWLLLSWVPLYLLFAVEDLIGPKAKLLQVLCNILNTAMIVLCFNVLNKDLEDDDANHMTGPALFALGFLLLVSVLMVTISVESPTARAQLREGGTVLTGISAGIAMALYVGRLQSKFFGPRPWLLVLLYSYTAIQPLVLYIEGHPVRALMLLDFALILKCLLYLYVTWLLHSGLLLFYFAKIKRTYASVDQQRTAFRNLLK
jgi:DNA-binding winged helix-turn-helix (wHTH) protein